MKFKFTLLFSIVAFQFASAQFNYINPLPGSMYHYPQTTIILKNGDDIDKASLANTNFIVITGSTSGNHSWVARLSDDNKTIIVKPDVPFNYGETVSVVVKSNLKKNTGERIDGRSFDFKIRNAITPEERERYRQADLQNFIESFGYDPTKHSNGSEQKVIYPLDSMPTYQINVNNNPAPGRIFYDNNQELDPYDSNSFPTIIKNDGTIVWARDCGEDGHDFKINQNGYLTYFKYEDTQWIVMDSNFNIIDSVQCKDGYESETNGHDLQIYPDGHSFLLAFDDQTIDMTPYGGVHNATVTGLIVQELDANKDVVFEWSSFDHFQFTDADSFTPLTNLVVDYIHGNAVNRDVDGNVLISCRNFDELTKIDHNTGNIIWRMGGENNQFTFVNDNVPQHFSRQHDLRRIANGHLTIFNNGTYLPVPLASAKEYAVDEVNKVATLVWYYEHPDVGINKLWSRGSGNAQRLPNGNTMISWGSITWNVGLPSMTEVDSNKNIVWEMTFDDAGQKSYRTFKFDWNPCSKITGYTMKAVNKPSATLLSWGLASGAKSYVVYYRKIGTTNWTTVSTKKIKISVTGLLPSTTYQWKVKGLCGRNPTTSSPFSVIDTFTRPPLKLDAMTAEDVPQINIYPVPSNENITIRVDNPENSSVVITNAMGSIVYENKITAAGSGTLDVDVKQWPAGFYIVNVNGEAHSFTRKILIQ